MIKLYYKENIRKIRKHNNKY